MKAEKTEGERMGITSYNFLRDNTLTIVNSIFKLTRSVTRGTSTTRNQKQWGKKYVGKWNNKSVESLFQSEKNMVYGT